MGFGHKYLKYGPEGKNKQTKKTPVPSSLS